MPNYKKICMNCQKELPIDSVFCQFCGSKDISSYVKQEKATVRCQNCGKELPPDSKFVNIVEVKILQV